MGEETYTKCLKLKYLTWVWPRRMWEDNIKVYSKEVGLDSSGAVYGLVTGRYELGRWRTSWPTQQLVASTYSLCTRPMHQKVKLYRVLQFCLLYCMGVKLGVSHWPRTYTLVLARRVLRDVLMCGEGNEATENWIVRILMGCTLYQILKMLKQGESDGRGM